MKPVQWKTYRTRFLVKAKQLTSSLTFTDHLGRQHCGRKGDYLVESFDGVLSIAPRHIFEDIYVPMVLTNQPKTVERNPDEIGSVSTAEQRTVALGTVSGLPVTEPQINRRNIQGLEIEEVQIEEVKIEEGEVKIADLKIAKPPVGRQPVHESRTARRDEGVRVVRKLPQPVRHRTSISGLRLM